MVEEALARDNSNEACPVIHQDSPIALLKNARLLYARGDFYQAHDFLSQALVASRLAYGHNHFSVAVIFNMMGDVLCDQGKFDQALEAYQSELALERILYPPTHQNIVKTLNNIARTYRYQEEWDKALVYYKEAITIIPRHNDALKPVSAKILFSIGVTFEMKGEFDLAQRYLTETVALYQGLKKSCTCMTPCCACVDYENGICLAKALNTLGIIQLKGGSPLLALPSFLEAIDIVQSLSEKRVLACAHFTSICLNAGKIYESIGGNDQALELYKKALRSELKNTGLHDDCNDVGKRSLPPRSLPNHKDRVLLCNRIGNIMKKLGDLDEALFYLDLSSKICIKYPGSISAVFASDIFTSLGSLYLQMGDRVKAAFYYDTAAYVL